MVGFTDDPNRRSLANVLLAVVTGGQWEGLNAQEKHGKEGFLAGEKGASRGFISQVTRLFTPL